MVVILDLIVSTPTETKRSVGSNQYKQTMLAVECNFTDVLLSKLLVALSHTWPSLPSGSQVL